MLSALKKTAKRIISSRKGSGILVLASIALVILLADPGTAHAQSAWLPWNWPKLIEDKTAQALVEAGKFLILWPYKVILLPLLAWLIALSGMMFDAALRFSIDSGTIVDLSPAINFAWTIIRDFCNMLFIFIMIWISISTILRASRYDTKRMLVKVIIAALLINFSLFFTKVAIDIGNIFTHWLYNGIQETVARSGSENQQLSQDLNVSAIVAERLGLYGIWTDEKAESLLSQQNGFILTSIQAAAASALIWFFVYATFLFLARFITLIFLLIFSPIGFIGGLLPQTASYAKKWRDELSQVIIFPIAFLLMFFLAIQFVDGVTNLADTVAPGVFTPSKDEYILYFQFVLVIMLFFAALKIAKENSGAAGKFFGGIASSVGGLVVGAGLGAATGGAGLALRATAGRAGAALASSKTVQNMVGSDSKTARVLGLGLKGAGTWTSKQSFDAGKAVTKGLGAVTGGELKANIPKFMQGGKGGYSQAQKDKRKAAEETLEFLDAKGDQKKMAEEAEKKAKKGAESLVDSEINSIESELKQAREKIKDQELQGMSISSEERAAVTSLEGKLAAKRSEYETAVKTEMDRRIKLERESNKKLDEAMTAVKEGSERVENYTESLKKGSIVEKTATAAAGYTVAMPVGAATYVGGAMTSGIGLIASTIGLKKIGGGIQSAGRATMEAAGKITRPFKSISASDKKFAEDLKDDWKNKKTGKNKKQKEMIEALTKEISGEKEGEKKEEGGGEAPKGGAPEGGGGEKK